MDIHNKVNNEADIQANIQANIHEDKPADSEKDIQAARPEDFQEELVKLRRYFHEHPELSWQEYHTQEKIMEYLDELEIPYKKSCKTGVIASIQGKKSTGKIIGIRADIDALPVTELSDCAWKSKTEGLMHACGHDTHITILLGTAKLLKQMEEELTVTVKLLFQPAEECIEDSGAGYMKEDPEALSCDRMIALHIWSKLPAGTASLRYGAVMTATDTFDIFVKGKGGHGALPHQTVDPVVAGSELVMSLQRIVSREISPLEPAVISVTSFSSGNAYNVIPGEAHLKGTARTFNPEIRKRYPEILNRVSKGVAEATRTEITVDYHLGPPPMINDTACVDTGKRAAAKVFGEENVLDWEPQMGGEDFAKFKAPKCLLFLGAGFPEEELRYPQHSPYFAINENVLKLGVEYFVEYVREFEKELSKEKL